MKRIIKNTEVKWVENKENVLQTIYKSISVCGQGKSHKDAVTDAFNNIKTAAYEEAQGYLVELHVTEFYIEKEEKSETIKRFLGLILPVTYEHYNISVTANTEIKMISISQKEEN